MPDRSAAAEGVEGGVETLPASTIDGVVRFGGDVVGKFIEVVVGTAQLDVAVADGRCEHEPFRGGIDEGEGSQRGGHLSPKPEDDPILAAALRLAGCRLADRTRNVPIR